MNLTRLRFQASQLSEVLSGLYPDCAAVEVDPRLGCLVWPLPAGLDEDEAKQSLLSQFMDDGVVANGSLFIFPEGVKTLP